jgi:preprotein translocase subunit YajC
MLWLYNFMFFMQVNQGQSNPAPAAPPAGAQEVGQKAAEQTPDAIGCGQGGMGIEFIIWMAVLFGLMYFMLIRPQKKQRKDHEGMLGSLKKGDKVVTTGGVLGTIRGLTNQVATLEVSDGLSMRVQKSHIAGLQVDTRADDAKKGSK